MLDRALQEAQQTRGQAGRQLDNAGDEGRQLQLKEAAAKGFTTSTAMNTGSYQDYLKLKVKAEGQYKAAVTGQNGVAGMIRRQRAQQAGVNAEWVKQGDLQEVREQRALEASAAGAVGASRLAGEEKMRADQKAADEKARTQETEAATSRHMQTVYGKWMDSHANGGGTEDRSRYAQILSGGVDNGWKLPGLTPEQSTNFGEGGDRRGWGIESDAWGTPSKSFGRPSTKKGTAY